MVGRAIAVVAALGVVGSFACSLTSLDGLSDGATPGTPGAEGGTGDATADAVVDAPSGSDAKEDAAFSCANAPAGAFCDDFENGLSKWESDISGGNSLATDDTSSVSPTHSVLSVVTGVGATCMQKTFPGAPQTIDVDADVRFDAKPSTSDDYDILGIRGLQDNNVSLQVRNGNLEIDEDIVPIDGGKNLARLTRAGVVSFW